MAEYVDAEAAQKVLIKSWNQISSKTRPPSKMQAAIDEIMAAPDVTFKYILVTAYLAKSVNPRIHARALQTGSSLRGAYDARSLCHGVIISFEKSRGNLFGLSNEPFVNKPARHPEHDGNNPQLRNRSLAQHLHVALELAQKGSADEVLLGLTHALRLGAVRADSDVRVKSTAKANLEELVAFITEFLKEADGGGRLVAVWGVFTQLLNEEGAVKVYPPNNSDLYSKTTGDVELFYGELLVSAAECKQRPLNTDDVSHGIAKAIRRQVAEYVFVISDGVVPGQEEDIARILQASASEIDSRIIDIRSELGLISIALNPLRRSKVGGLLVDFLRTMRKFDSANFAAELWNRTIT
jgi:hypothetical protein